MLYIENAESADEEAIKDYLKTKLPDYMTPALIERIDKIPVTANGKVDRKRLKNMKSDNVKNARTEPENKTEYEIGGVFARISGARSVNYEGSFFEMGIDSLKAVVIINELKKLGYDIGLTDIYNCGSIAALAQAAQQKQEDKANDDEEQFEDGEI